MQNVFDSIGFAKGFNPAVENATTDMKKALTNSKAQLSAVQKKIKAKIEKNKTEGKLSDEQFTDEMAWVLNADK